MEFFNWHLFVGISEITFGNKSLTYQVNLENDTEAHLDSWVHSEVWVSLTERRELLSSLCSSQALPELKIKCPNMPPPLPTQTVRWWGVHFCFTESILIRSSLGHLKTTPSQLLWNCGSFLWHLCQLWICTVWPLYQNKKPNHLYINQNIYQSQTA